jgi:protease-4
MKEFFRAFFGSLLAMIVMGVLLFIGFLGVIVSISRSLNEKDETHKGNVVTIDLTKKIHEQGESNPLAKFIDGTSRTAGLYEITRAVAAAKKDKDIKGILLKLGPTPNGWAELQQLKAALEEFRTSGKFVYAYGERITQGAYFVATSADSIYLNPVGDIELKGLSTELAFFKHTLERLELKPQIFYAGKFKSATEPFREEKMTEPNRQQITTLQAGLWNQFLGGAAKYMRADTNTINQLTTSGAIQFPADALRHRMVAGLLYWDEVEQRIRVKTGQEEKKDVKYISINEYASDLKPELENNNTRIAVLFAEGEIVDGDQKTEHASASTPFCEEVRKLRKDDKVKAVVLRVNSPGGSALASEVILRELTLLKQKKPVVVSMGDYAASGGYYIACKANRIFAMPNTITGSIGVFGMFFNVENLMKNKLGVTFDGVKNAPFADMPSATRTMTEQEARMMQNSVDTTYAHFKGRVVEGRALSSVIVDSIAQGRVWNGTDAKELGLVDELGGIDQAIASAAGFAKVKDYKVVTYPEPSDKFGFLLRKFANDESAKAAIKAALQEEMGAGYEWYDRIQTLSKMNGRTMMSMPFIISVH